MPRYMVVYKSDDGTQAWFTDDPVKAEEFRMNCECGMGWSAQVYRWADAEDYKNDPYDSDQYMLWYE